MENQLLKDKAVYPSDEVIEKALGGLWPVYESFVRAVTGAECGLTMDWHYYRDAPNAWLCKVVYKKKTVLWLSLWEGFVKTSFYFLDRHMEGLAALGLDEANYTLHKEWGKMIPLVFDIRCEAQLPDVLKVTAFKKTAK